MKIDELAAMSDEDLTAALEERNVPPGAVALMVGGHKDDPALQMSALAALQLPTQEQLDAALAAYEQEVDG